MLDSNQEQPFRVTLDSTNTQIYMQLFPFIFVQAFSHLIKCPHAFLKEGGTDTWVDIQFHTGHVLSFIFHFCHHSLGMCRLEHSFLASLSNTHWNNWTCQPWFWKGTLGSTLNPVLHSACVLLDGMRAFCPGIREREVNTPLYSLSSYQELMDFFSPGPEIVTCLSIFPSSLGPGKPLF